MEPTVSLRQGTYVGRHHPRTPTQPRGLDIFLGIPYALSTGGEHRFRPARPIPSGGEFDGKGEFKARELGHISPFTDAANEPCGSGEDCLTVNVIVPSSARKDGSQGYGGDARKDGERGVRGGLPVVVYFHGGAFNMGHGHDRDMLSFVSHSRDLVAVSFNYRLGTLGFLPSASVATEAGQGALNLGLGDQRAAMAWVGRNIGAFGGDAGRVGVMGISAGAHSIGHHLLSAPPFQKAILESGAPTARAVLDPHHPRHEGHFTELLSALSIPAADPAPLSKLREVPLAELTAAAKKVWEAHAESVTWPFQPVIDGPGGLIPQPPLALLKQGKGRGVPLITGFCTHEGTAFVPPAHSPSTFRSFFKALIPGLTPADLDTLDALYPFEEYSEDPPLESLGKHWRRLEAAYAHYAYIAPVLQTAEYLSSYAPVYVYEFAVRDGVLGTANHTDQTPYVTRSAGELGHEGLREVAGKMHGFFSEFLVGDGELDGAGWPRYRSPFKRVGRGEGEGAGEGTGEGLGKIMVFGKGNTEQSGGGEKGAPCEVRTLGEREMERIRFWWERVGLSQGMGDSLDL